MGNEAFKSQASAHHEDFDRTVDNAGKNQVLGSETEDRIRNAVNSDVIGAENHIQDAILTAMHNVVILRVEIAVKLMKCSSRIGPNSMVRILIEKDFRANTGKTPLRLASSRLDSNIEQD